MTISISCMVLFVVFCNSVWTQETKKISPRVKELQQQRLTVLEELRVSARSLFQNARIEFEAVYAAERDLLAARIEYAETQNDRIKACDEAVKNALEFYEVAQARKQSAQGTHSAELKAKGFLLEAQIAREKAVANE